MSDLPELELPSGERLQVTGPVVIGRGADCDVVIPDSEASRRHVEIQVNGDAYLINDLESRNGTTLNGARLTRPQPLKDGDVVRIGQTTLVFRHPLPVEQAAPLPDLPPIQDSLATVVAPRLEPTVRQASVAGSNSPMQVLGRLTRAIATLDDARVIADTVTSALRDEYGCEGASLLLLEPAGSLYFASVASDSPSLKLITLRSGQGIVGRAVETGEPQLVTDVGSDAGHASHVDRSLGFTSKSIVAAPVFGADGKAMGALEIINPRRKLAFDGDDLEFCTLVATQLGPALSRAKDWSGIERERAALTRVAGIRSEFIAESPAMIRLVMEAASLNEARTPVYLAGEPGTGKRMLARLVHEASGNGGALIEVGPGKAIPAAGAFHITNLQDLEVEAQGALAGALSAAAGTRPVFVSGNATLLSLVSAGKLSPVLHDALEAGQLALPPLRSRDEELAALTAHFAARTATRLDREPFLFGADAAARLAEYGWPGNVAQLAAAVHRVGVLAREQEVELATLLIAAPELLETPDGQAAAAASPIERRLAARLGEALGSAASADPGEREDAARALGADGSPEAVAVLAPLLGDPEAAVRVAAADALPATLESANALATRLEVEAELDVAMSLLEALGGTGHAGETPIVARALRAGDPRMRRLAMRLLRKAGAPIESAESMREDPDAIVRAEATAALIAAGEPLEETLLALTSSTEEVPVRAAACELLGDLGLAPERLIELTANEDRAVRVAAVRALGHSGSAEAREALVDMLEDGTVSAEVATALGRLGAAKAVPRLSALAFAPEAPAATRRAVVKALAQIPGDEALAALARAAQDDLLRDAVLDVADSVPSLAADPNLIEARVQRLLERGATSPSAAIESLRSFASLAATADRALLIDAIPEAPPDRDLAVDFLVQLDEPACAGRLLAWREESPAASAGLARLGPRAVPPLLALLDGPQAVEASEALGALGPGVVGGLLPLLSDRELSRPASRAIIEIGAPALPALVDAIESSTPDTLPALLQVFGQVAPGRLAFYVATFLKSEHPAVRYAALIALGNLPDARSETEFLARLDSNDAAERTMATLALGRIQSADGFETLTGRVGEGDRRSQYALAGAINEYNLRQGPVLEIIRRMVREGLPFSSAAIEAGFTSGQLTEDDVLAALHGPSIPDTQKLRLIAAVAALTPEQALAPLFAAAQGDLPESLRAAAVAGIGRHEVAARERIAQMLLEPATRERGTRILGAMQDARSLMFVLRKIAPAIESDPALRAALRSQGDLVLGPLIDVIAQNWDLESLGLLWQLSEVVEQTAPARE